MEEEHTNTGDKAICPFCDSQQVHKIANFSGTQMVKQYLCESCHSIFERIKW